MVRGRNDLVRRVARSNQKTTEIERANDITADQGILYKAQILLPDGSRK